MVFNEDINIVVAGEAGQGIETAAKIITKILHCNNFNTFSFLEYMSRTRGGCNSVLIKVSKEKSPCFSSRIDVLFAIDDKAFEHLKDRITDNTISLNLKKKNFYVTGYIAALFKLNSDKCLDLIKTYFEKFFQEKNINDFNEGFSDGGVNAGVNTGVNSGKLNVNTSPSPLGGEDRGEGLNIQIEIPTNRNSEENMLISGNDAFGLGCIAGGCNFIPFYPMSPSTFLHFFLTRHADEFSIVSKQVEDEICVINMALGAWYAGARAIASSAGGGFSLMCEGVSLAGMIESPIVINIAQRPAPATGLPTRTEQADLNLALYSGHGEFSRAVYAPSTVEDAFKIGQIAFDMADKFQIPVFVLTDQAMLESTYSAKEFIFETKPVNYFEQSNPDYKRYKLSENPVSPRAIPAFGEGIVCVDSDEHDENGWITEDFNVRKKMVEKRLGKLEQIINNIYPPYFIGEENYKVLIISWGSNFHVIKEAIKDKKDYALLHFVQVYPVNKIISDYTKKAEKLVIIEQNATGQFEKLLKCEFGINFDKKLFKYSGLPFSIEEIKTFLEEIQSDYYAKNS